jgi:hypothetical protein
MSPVVGWAVDGATSNTTRNVTSPTMPGPEQKGVFTTRKTDDVCSGEETERHTREATLNDIVGGQGYTREQRKETRGTVRVEQQSIGSLLTRESPPSRQETRVIAHDGREKKEQAHEEWPTRESSAVREEESSERRYHDALRAPTTREEAVEEATTTTGGRRWWRRKRGWRTYQRRNYHNQA